MKVGIRGFLSCRMSRGEIRAMRGAGVPMQLINGRSDLVAGLCWVKKLAKQLRCPLILTGRATTFLHSILHKIPRADTENLTVCIFL